MEEKSSDDLSGIEDISDVAVKPNQMEGIIGKEALREICARVRFPKEVEMDHFIILGSTAFRNMPNFEFAEVLIEMEKQVPGFEAFKEIRYIDNYAFPEVFILEAEEKTTVEKMSKVESFQYKGKDIVVVVPKKENVIYAHLHTHFPYYSLGIVRNVISKYAEILRCETQTYENPKMKTILNGKFKLQLKLRKGFVLEDIPQLVKFKGFNARIIVQGQQRRCFKCMQVGHMARSCGKSQKSSKKEDGKIGGEEYNRKFPALENKLRRDSSEENSVKEKEENEGEALIVDSEGNHNMGEGFSQYLVELNGDVYKKLQDNEVLKIVHREPDLCSEEVKEDSCEEKSGREEMSVECVSSACNAKEDTEESSRNPKKTKMVYSTEEDSLDNESCRTVSQWSKKRKNRKKKMKKK